MTEALYLKYLCAQYNLTCASVEFHPTIGKYCVYLNIVGKAFQGMAETVEVAAKEAADKLDAFCAAQVKPVVYDFTPPREPMTQEDRDASAADRLYQQRQEEQ